MVSLHIWPTCLEEIGVKDAISAINNSDGHFDAPVLNARAEVTEATACPVGDLAKKMQLKAAVQVVNDPGLELDLPRSDEAAAVLVFVRNADELETHKSALVDVAQVDGMAWLAYPKGGQLNTDLNRDKLWAAMQGTGVRPVRQVSIDGTWSALRFRPE